MTAAAAPAQAPTLWDRIVKSQERWSPSDGVPTTFHDAWIRGVELPTGPYLVPGRIPYGIWSHTAPPGAYKSAMFSQIEMHLAYGVPLPGLQWEFVEHGDCLVIAPDESPDEVQSRSLRIAPGGTFSHDGGDWESAQHHILYVMEPRGETAEDRVSWLHETICRLETESGRRIVWIRWDTLGHLLGAPSVRMDAYTHTKSVLQRLNQRMAMERRVLATPTHLGKDGRTVGSTAIQGHSNLVTDTELTYGEPTGRLMARKVRGAAL